MFILWTLNFVLGIVSFFLTALYIKITWGWFVTPLTDIDSPPIVYILGILIMIGFANPKHAVSASDLKVHKNKEFDSADNVALVIINMVIKFVAFAIAAIIYYSFVI